MILLAGSSKEKYYLDGFLEFHLSIAKENGQRGTLDITYYRNVKVYDG